MTGGMNPIRFIVEEAIKSLGIRPSLEGLLLGAREAIRGDAALERFAWHCYRLLNVDGRGLDPDWLSEDSRSRLGPICPLFFAVVYFSSFENLLKRNRARVINDDITRATNVV